MACPLGGYSTMAQKDIDWSKFQRPERILTLECYDDDVVELVAHRLAISCRIWSHITDNDEEASFFYNEWFRISNIAGIGPQKDQAMSEFKVLLSESRKHPNNLRREKAYDDFQMVHIEFEKRQRMGYLKRSFYSISENFSLISRKVKKFPSYFCERFHSSVFFKTSKKVLLFIVSKNFF